jgi:hypothetical protein
MFKWRKKQRARAAPVEGAKAPPPPPDRGPVREVLADGTIVEYSAATGRSILVPAGPARRGVDISAGAPGWSVWHGLRRWFGR